MDNLIAGLIAVSLVLLFLSFYVIKLTSVPLTIIIVAVFAMICVDFVQSVRNGGD